MKPQKIQVVKNVLSIEWNDKTNSNLEASFLRKHCPCAVCTSEPDGSDEMKIRRFTEQQLQIAAVSIVGNYALNIVWEDGHNTGIYEFSYLKVLSKEQAV